MRIFLILFAIQFCCGCKPSAKFAQKKFSIPAIDSGDDLRTEGFYYNIRLNQFVGADWPYYVSVLFLYNDGTLVGSTGFGTADTSMNHIKDFIGNKLVMALERSGNGWGRYEVKGDMITKEFWLFKSKGFRNLGLVRQSGTIMGSTSILFDDEMICKWCDFIRKPEERYYFEPFGIKPDSSKAFFK